MLTSSIVSSRPTYQFSRVWGKMGLSSGFIEEWKNLDVIKSKLVDVHEILLGSLGLYIGESKRNVAGEEASPRDRSHRGKGKRRNARVRHWRRMRQPSKGSSARPSVSAPPPCGCTPYTSCTRSIPYISTTTARRPTARQTVSNHTTQHCSDDERHVARHSNP